MQMILSLLDIINWFGSFLPQLGLRAILAYEFWKAGYTKYTGENWFIHILDQFPYPLSEVPVEISWTLATWTELLGAVALVLGLATRFFSFSLIILTVVAILSAHMPPPDTWSNLKELWQLAYHHKVMSNGNYGFEIPLLYLLMLLPLVFQGAGKLSLDHLILSWIQRRTPKKGNARLESRFL